MGDYSGYITATYAISGIGLLLMAVMSYRAMKRSEKEAASLRRRRKGQD